jgi:hypothetical protein
MTRHIIAASIAALMFAAPAIAFAQTDATATPAAAPKKAKTHHKKKAAPAPAADSTTK